MDDPTLWEVLGQISTPGNENIKGFFSSNDEEECRVNRQLVEEYKSIVEKETGSKSWEKSDSNMSLSLMAKIEENWDPSEYRNEEERKLTMSMLTKERTIDSQYEAEEPPKTGSIYNKIQNDLNSLKLKIKDLKYKHK